jgi:hypothetical protein
MAGKTFGRVIAGSPAPRELGGDQEERPLPRTRAVWESGGASAAGVCSWLDVATATR